MDYNLAPLRSCLSTLRALLGSKVGEDLFDTLIELLNSEPDKPRTDKVPDTPLVERSGLLPDLSHFFQDSNGDGLGDLQVLFSGWTFCGT